MHDNRPQRHPWLDSSPLLSAVPEPMATTGWQQHAPRDPLDPTAEEATALIAGVDGWMLAGASLRGKMHAHRGAYREDAFAFAVYGEWHLVVVADGAGSRVLSRVGARTVSAAAIAGLQRGLDVHVHHDAPAPDQVRLVLLAGLNAACAALDLEAQRRGVPLRDLASTLLILAHAPALDYLATAQIGDGAIMAIQESGAFMELAEPQSGDHAGETQFFSDIAPRDWPAYLRILRIRETPLLLLAMTDGVADDLLPYQRYLAELGGEVLIALEDPDPELALLQVLRYEKAGSSDDRTLVVLARGR